MPYIVANIYLTVSIADKAAVLINNAKSRALNDDKGLTLGHLIAKAPLLLPALLLQLMALSHP